jgi:ABC-type phosphate transport system substrate-binding protein
MRKPFAHFLIAGTLALGLAAAAAAADYVVIVNKDNGNPVDAEFLAKIYRGEAKSWPAGGSVAAVALPEESPVRAAFDKAVLGKTPSQSRSLWAQLTFTGKAVPPKMADSDEDVVKMVADNKGAVGYVSPKAKIDNVKAVK